MLVTFVITGYWAIAAIL